MDWMLIAVGIVLILFVLLFIGTPIGFALGTTSLMGILLFVGPSYISSIANIAWGSINMFILIAIPLFVLMSEIITFTGISRDLYQAVERWTANIPGSLAVATVFACAIFGAISGTSVGVAVMVGSIAIPEMLKRGYSDEIAAGSVAGASGLGLVIPPSITLILYGVVTGISVGDLFIAGILPGLLVTILFSTYIIFTFWKNQRRDEKKEVKTYTPTEKLKSLAKITPVVGLIVLIIGGIYTGITTPTEASAVGVVASLIIAALYRRLTWKSLWNALMSSTKTSCMALIILVTATFFGYLMNTAQIPQNLSSWIVTLDLSKWIIFAIIMFAYLILGMFLDGNSIVLVSIPITFPIITSLGFDPIWFAIVLMINICAGTITPPVGICAYMVKSLAPQIPLSKIFKSVIPFLVLDCVAIAILCIFPEITTILVDMIK